MTSLLDRPDAIQYTYSIQRFLVFRSTIQCWFERQERAIVELYFGDWWDYCGHMWLWLQRPGRCMYCTTLNTLKSFDPYIDIFDWCWRAAFSHGVLNIKVWKLCRSIHHRISSAASKSELKVRNICCGCSRTKVENAKLMASSVANASLLAILKIPGEEPFQAEIPRKNS